MSSKPDVYSRITDKIFADLEKGVRPWMKPWNAEHAAGRITRPLRHNGEAYRGINIIMLWASAMEQGFAAPIWMTYRQAQELGGQVRKGSKGSLVVYANTIKKTETDEATGEEVEQEIPFMKGYTAFNVEQIEGLPEDYYALTEPVLDPVERIDHAEQFFASLGADIRHGGNRAFYALQPDYVQMPPFESFNDAESFYATLGHESVHWTRHVRPGSIAISVGRLGAMRAMRARSWSPSSAQPSWQRTSASTWSRARITLLTLTSWLDRFSRNDKRAIFSAASHAQRAVDFLHARQAAATATFECAA